MYFTQKTKSIRHRQMKPKFPPETWTARKHKLKLKNDVPSWRRRQPRHPQDGGVVGLDVREHTGEHAARRTPPAAAAGGVVTRWRKGMTIVRCEFPFVPEMTCSLGCMFFLSEITSTCFRWHSVVYNSSYQPQCISAYFDLIMVVWLGWFQ
jgi:hypothetical protein